MSIAGTVVLAVDGTHCAGKSTLARDLVRHYRAAGVDATHAGDVARDSPLVSAVVASPGARFGLDIELDLIAATISTQLRAAAGHELLITDKTAANVRAYAELFLTPDERNDPLWSAAAELCTCWQPYDLVVRCTDHYAIDLTLDGYRAKVVDLQSVAAQAVGAALQENRYSVLDLPQGLDPDQRVAWIAAHPLVAGLVPPPAQSRRSTPPGRS